MKPSAREHIGFIKIFTLSFLAFSITILVINIYVDPRGVFGTGKYPVLVATARAEKAALLESFNPRPQVLIMGSSHTMRYSPEIVYNLLGLRTFNLSVNAGKIEDFVALLRYSIDELKIRPKMIILGMCQRTLCLLENEDFDKRLTSNAVLMKYVPLNPLIKLWRNIVIYGETLNWNYLKDVKRSIAFSKTKSGLVKYLFHSDGFLSKEGSFNKKGTFSKMEVFRKDCDVTGFSEERIKYFKIFRDICKKNNITLKIVIEPYAPEYIQQVNLFDGSYTRLNQQLLDLLRTLNVDNDYEIYDFSDIDKFGGVDEFMGYAHPSIRNSSLILQSILGKRIF